MPSRTFKHAMNTGALGTATLVVLLALWRIAYSLSDWAALALLVLAGLLFMSQMRTVGMLYRARMRMLFRDESSLAKWFTGQINACLIALLFVATAVPVLAWQALRASWSEALGLAALSLLGGLVLAWMQGRARRHLQPPFVNPPAALLATWAVALPAILLLAYLHYNFVAFPGEIRAAADPWAAAVLGIEMNLPARRGWVAEALAPLAAWEAVTLWFVTRANMPAFVSLLFVVEAAMVGFVVTRAGVLATLFFQHYLSEAQPAADAAKGADHA